MDTLLLSGMDTTGTVITGGDTSGYIDVLNHLPVVGSFVQSVQDFIPVAWLNAFNSPFLVIVFIWVLIIFWVLKDSTYRSSNGFFPIFSLLLVTIATPVVGLPIYLAIRPIGYKYERAYWKMIMQGYKITDDTLYEEQFLQEEDDQEHLAKLHTQAALAEKRTKRVINKTPAKKLVVVKPIKKPVIKAKTSASQSSSRKIPTAKKAVTRTAK